MPETENPADEPAHDVLAAEAFAVPAPDPSLKHAPVQLPEDPTGIAEPHDVLAAEEFALPAARPSRVGGAVGGALRRQAKPAWWLGLAGAVAALVALAVWRRGPG